MPQTELTFVKHDRQCDKVDEKTNKVDRQSDKVDQQTQLLTCSNK
jgi:hypothetical protein